jgi:uncharacterized protein
MPYKFRRFVAAAAMVGAMAFGASPSSAERLVFMTGPAGGTWFPLGAAVQKILQEEVSGLTVDLRPGAGLINIRGVAEGKADLGWGNVISTVDAHNGNPPFQSKITSVCNVASFYTQYAQLVSVNADVKGWADMKGKKFATLPRGNTTEIAAQNLLSAVDLSYKDLTQVNYASVSDQVNMAKDGQVDAIFVVTSVPSGAFLDLANSRTAHFIPIADEQFDRLKKANAGWLRKSIPANTYPNQPAEVQIAGFAMHLLANCEGMKEETGYNITKAIAKRVQELGSISRQLGGFTTKDLATDTGVPFHPGAARFYKEAGAL